MKFLAILAILSCLSPPLPAQEWNERDLPRDIRVIVEYVEAPHELVTEVMLSEHADSGPKLHARLRELVKEGKAHIMETSIVVARPGQKATVESIGEFIAPAVYDHSGCFPLSPPSSDPPPAPEKKNYGPRPEWPSSFETRNVGVTLEIEPNLGPNNTLVDLRLAPEIVDRLRFETWVTHKDRWGDAPLRRPTYESLDTRTGITLVHSTWGFVGLHTPHHPDGGRDFSRKIMLFVRADIIPIENPATWKP